MAAGRDGRTGDASVVAGTAPYEPVPLALRRTAQQDASSRRFADGC